ncbi:MAG: hypothetical protein QXS69_01630 [Candidatus Aenigmatarchaeota archaeon]
METKNLNISFHKYAYRIDEILGIKNEWWITEKVKEELAPSFRHNV